MAPLSGPTISRWCGGATHAVAATTILQVLASGTVAIVVHFVVVDAATLAVTAKVAAAEEDHCRLTVCMGLPALRVKLEGVAVGAPVTALTILELLTILAAGHGTVADEHANACTGSEHRVAEPSCRIS